MSANNKGYSVRARGRAINIEPCVAMLSLYYIQPEKLFAAMQMTASSSPLIFFIFFFFCCRKALPLQLLQLLFSFQKYSLSSINFPLYSASASVHTLRSIKAFPSSQTTKVELRRGDVECFKAVFKDKNHSHFLLTCFLVGSGYPSCHNT